jgi:hypothetical protein
MGAVHTSPLQKKAICFPSGERARSDASRIGTLACTIKGRNKEKNKRCARHIMVEGNSDIRPEKQSI